MGDIASCCDTKQIGGQLGQKIIGAQLGQKIIQNTQQQIHTSILIPPTISNQINTILQKGKSTVYFQKPSTNQSDTKLIKVPTSNNPIIYQGQTINNQADGHGILYFSNGTIFQGTFQKGQPINGVYVLNQQSFYVGNIQNFQANGKGLYQNLEIKYGYEGQWAKNMPHGQGYERFTNGDEYVGQYVYGSKFGQGDYTFKNGARYVGRFYNGHSDGFGKLTYPKGQSYEGQWKLGYMHGRGIFKWPNGDVYEGQYVNGKKHGHGKYKFINGALYEGYWRQGVQQGEGQVRQGYDVVHGIWKNGVKLQQK